MCESVFFSAKITDLIYPFRDFIKTVKISQSINGIFCITDSKLYVQIFLYDTVITSLSGFHF